VDALLVEDGDAPRHRAHHLGGALLAPHEQHHQRREAADQHHPDQGGGQVQGVVARPAGRHRDHQPQPQEEIEHHRRADPLGGHGEGGVGAGQPRAGEEPEAERAARRRAARHHVAERQGGQLDAQQGEERRCLAAGDHRPGQVRVAEDRAGLEHDPERDQPQVDAGQQAEGAARARDLGQHEVDHHEGDQQQLHEAPDRRGQPRLGPGHVPQV
jgi:hypothetical protein